MRSFDVRSSTSYPTTPSTPSAIVDRRRENFSRNSVAGCAWTTVYADNITTVIRDGGLGISDGQVSGEPRLVRSVPLITLHLSLSITDPESPIPNHYAVILMATAVMSSFGGVSPLNAQTAEKIASTISRAD